ncbi:MAG: TrkA-N domain protein, partial [Pelotomaculum thermopropionicum]
MTSSGRAVFVGTIILVLLILGGSFIFMGLEGLSFLDAVWLTVITITTVGFGDIVPRTQLGRAIALFVVVGGVWLFTYVLSNIFSALIEGHLIDFWGKRRMMKKIAAMKNHVVVCGIGRVGQEVVTELNNHRTPLVVIDKDEQKLKELREAEVLFVTGDATDDKILLLARVEYAAGIIITLPDDAANLFVTISAKDLNPGIRIITRANSPENVDKIKRAGADSVICPSLMAGNRMALSAV